MLSLILVFVYSPLSVEPGHTYCCHDQTAEEDTNSIYGEASEPIIINLHAICIHTLITHDSLAQFMTIFCLMICVESKEYL